MKTKVCKYCGRSFTTPYFWTKHCQYFCKLQADRKARGIPLLEEEHCIRCGQLHEKYPLNSILYGNKYCYAQCEALHIDELIYNMDIGEEYDTL